MLLLLFLATIVYALWNDPFTDDVEAYASRTYFYIGGQYVNATLPETNTTGQYMTGQIYVERLVPQTTTHQHPIIFITGVGQTGTNWLNTPDGREGWASYFLRQGYEVFLTDMAQRGRAPYLPGEGSLQVISTSTVENDFTAPEDVRPRPYPQAYLHTQWPGSRHVGDPVFDAFFASQVPSQSNLTTQAQYNNASYTALVDKIGTPVFVVTHSQGGPFGWQLGDGRPELVKGIISLEPQGPPFQDYRGPPFAPGYLSLGGPRPYGLTDLPLHYDPPIGDNSSLLEQQSISAANANVSSCLVQAEPARKLSSLAQIPVLLITGEASYHSVYDYCTVKFLEQAGVEVEHAQLGELGFHGNAHFSFLERNNLDIAQHVVSPFLERHCQGNGTW